LKAEIFIFKLNVVVSETDEHQEKRMNLVDIVVIGNIIKETIQFQSRTIGPVLGSPAAYSSLVMAKLGKKVGLVSYYGDDMPDAISELSIVDRSGLIKHPFTTRNLLVYRPDGSKYVEYQAKAPVIQFEQIPAAYLDCQFFYICPMNYEVDLELIKSLHVLGKTVVIDLGGYGGATSDIRYSVDEEKGERIIDQLCRSSTIIKASAEDLQSIIPGQDAEGAAQYLVSRSAKQVVVTLGGKGALYQLGFSSPFGAGFMAYYQETQDIDPAVRFGSATASLVIEKTGGCIAKRMPDRIQVNGRFSNN
jgi:sugar/nucleoside kinase (ribokinase family)